MDKCAKKLLEWLDVETKVPLSFAVFVPEWTDTEYSNILSPSRCKYCVQHFTENPKKHFYVSGAQHSITHKDMDFLEKSGQNEEIDEYSQGLKERYWVLPFSTHVYFLQNELGQKKWKLTKEMVSDFRSTFQT